jgi:XTP/dITP diphosphohydrolase
MTPRDILLATGNPSKAREMREILGADLPANGAITWRSLKEFPDWPAPVETGETFMANAELKATYYARLSGLQRLAGVPDERRTARFRCAVALSDGSRILARATGAVEGRIIDQPRGTNGFGYDPHFWVDRFGMTTAEMSPEQKHAISHRGQALRELRAALQQLL